MPVKTRGGVASTRLWTFATSKNRILSAVLCLARYFVCARAPSPDSRCATVSCRLPHILHLTSCSVLILVFLALYILVGKSCWYNSWIPATMCVMVVFHSDIQAKQPLSRSSSFPSVCHQVSLSSLLLYHHFACSALLSWPILRSSAFPPPPLLWCGQLVFELDLTIRGASKAKRSVYNFKRANWPALKELLWHTPGDLAFFPNDVNKSLSTWTDLFVSAVNEHIPKWTTRSVSVQPLIDTELLTLIKKKNRQRKKESTKDESGHWCWEIPTTKTQNQRRVIFTWQKQPITMRQKGSIFSWNVSEPLQTKEAKHSFPNKRLLDFILLWLIK